uniref:Uncharacterized protein n=1 Tax=Physcomitrium patens TaxID=3218 RepID=A0A2K1JGL6_PHYPA|nr:hypothetical protein PHYPA_018104 [Physcomitrium patens]
MCLPSCRRIPRPTALSHPSPFWMVVGVFIRYVWMNDKSLLPRHCNASSV